MGGLWVRAPDHLGDGVQALPCIAALGAVAVAGPPWVEVLYREHGVRREDSPARGDTAILLKPSFSAAWQARRAARRVGLVGDGRRWLLTTPVSAGGAHRGADYAAVVAAATGLLPPGPPRFAVTADERAAARALLSGPSVLLLPGTRKPQTVAWSGFAALAAALARDRAVLAAGGPGEEALVAAVGGDGALPPPSLPALAALAVEVVAGGGAVVGNDSGLSHLAAAAVRGAGLDTARVHVVYGSTDPARTGPPGTTGWAGDRPPCWPCFAERCAVMDAGAAPCLTAPWAPLRDAILA